MDAITAAPAAVDITIAHMHAKRAAEKAFDAALAAGADVIAAHVEKLGALAEAEARRDKALKALAAA